MESTQEKHAHSVKLDSKPQNEASAIAHATISSSSALVEAKSTPVSRVHLPLAPCQTSNPAMASGSILLPGSENISAAAETSLADGHQSNISHTSVSASTTVQSSLLMSNYCSGPTYSGSPNFCANQGIIFSAPNITPFGLFRNSGFFSGPLSSNGQPQAIILNQFGQPLGIGSQPTVFAVPFTPTSQSSSTEPMNGGGGGGGGSSKALSQQPPSTPIHQPPLVMAYRAPSIQHSVVAPVGSQLSSFNVSNAPSHQLPLFPNVGANATSALAAVSAFNAPILLPSGQMVFRTPHGQLIGFQVPTLNRNGICSDASVTGSSGGHFAAKFPLPKTYSSSAPLTSHSSQHSVLTHGGSKHSLPSSKSHIHADSRDAPEAKVITSATSTTTKVSVVSAAKVASSKETKTENLHNEKTAVIEKTTKIRSCNMNLNGSVPDVHHNGTGFGVDAVSTATALDKRPEPQLALPPSQSSPLSPFLSPKELIEEGSQKFAVSVESDIHAMFLQQLEEYAKSAKPQVLNHLVDGFVIQESVEPFPFTSYPFEDFSLLEAESFDACLLPPLLTPEQTSETSLSPQPLFCKSESDKQSAGYSPEVSSATLQPSQTSPKISNDTDVKVAATSDQDQMASPSHWKRGRLDTVSSDSSFPYQPPTSKSAVVSESAPEHANLAYLEKNPSEWSVQEVQMWLSTLGPGVAQYCSTFQQQEIDGQALLLLHEDHLVRTMGLKLGPAVKVCAALKVMRG